jgi:hypothetical protein
MAGVSLADIADLLGHRDLATTQIYAKVLQEHLRAAVGKLPPLLEQLEGGSPDIKALPPAVPAVTEQTPKEETTPVAGRRKATGSRRPTQTSRRASAFCCGR